MASFIATTGILPRLSGRASISPLRRPLARPAARPRAMGHPRRAASGAPRMADSPPIDAPSGVLLVLSSVLAIASVGCVFELSGGHPQYGASFTAAVLVVSLPGFLFFFYSAIRKGQQEALDDP